MTDTAWKPGNGTQADADLLSDRLEGERLAEQEAEAILQHLVSALSPPNLALRQAVAAGRLETSRAAEEEGEPFKGRREAKRLLMAEARYRALVEQIPAVTFMAALDESINELYVSPQIEALLGFSQKEWLEDPVLWYTQLHPDDRDRWHVEFALTVATGVRFRSEYRFLARDGRVVWVQGEAQIVRDEQGRPLFLQGVAFDITERKQAEEKLLKLNEELERRVRDRTAELDAVNRDLVQKSAENEMFVYSVSHDLRSPLVNLQGFSKELEKGVQQLAALLREEAVPPAVRDRGRALLDEKMGKSIGFIQTSVLRLSNIIDALLRLSRIGRIEYRREQIDVTRVVGQVITALQGTIAEKGAAVRVGDLPPAWGDRTAVEQVFANLIGNALKYLDPKRPGHVEVGSASPTPDREADALRTYYVRDNGLGIPESGRVKVFQPFQRLHPRAAPGEGMGLTIVQRVVERHGGKIWVESEVGTGSTFFVALPVPQGSGVRNQSEVPDP